MRRALPTSDLGLWTTTAIAALVLLTVGVGFTYLLEAQQRSKARSELTTRTASAAQAIERQLTYTLSATRMLAVFVRQGHGRIADFNQVASDIMREVKGISSLALAPKGVVRAVYPRGSAATPLGLDVMADAERGNLARAAVKLRTATLTGPIDVDPNGAVLIGRLPVFMQRRPRPDGEFWGFTVVIVRLPELLRSADLAEALGHGTLYRLSRAEPGQAGFTEFYRSADAPLEQPVEASIVVPGGEWVLAAAPRGGWGRMTDRVEFWGMLLAVAAGTGMFHLLLRQQRRIAELALYDPLTGLANRAHFEERATFALNQARRNDQHLAVLFIDLNGFKRVNDRYGHAAGDALLKELARRLQSNVRTVDTVARVGGDEFVVVLSGLGSKTEHEIVRRKLEGVLRPPCVINGRRLEVGVSVGASVYPDNGETLDELIAQADRSMYRTKRLTPPPGSRRGPRARPRSRTR